MIQNYNSREIQNVLQTLQKHYNILVIYHHSSPDDKRIILTKSFSPIANLVSFISVIGKDITELIDTNQLTQYLDAGAQTNYYVETLQRQTISTQIEDLPDRIWEFSPDFTWVWWKMS